MPELNERIMQALGEIGLPNGKSLTDLDMIRALNVTDGAVRFVIEAAPEIAPKLEAVRDAAQKAVEGLEGVTSYLSF